MSHDPDDTLPIGQLPDPYDKILNSPADDSEHIFDDALTPEPDGWPEPPHEPVPINLNTERQAFAELLALLSAEDDGDADTAVTALSLEDFAAGNTPNPDNLFPLSNEEPRHE